VIPSSPFHTTPRWGPTLPTLYKEKEAFVNPSEVESFKQSPYIPSMDLVSAKCGTTFYSLNSPSNWIFIVFSAHLVKHMACKGAHSLAHFTERISLLDPMLSTRRIIQRIEIISKTNPSNIHKTFSNSLVILQ
jgi:hypothetical protein